MVQLTGRCEHEVGENFQNRGDEGEKKEIKGNTRENQRTTN